MVTAAHARASRVLVLIVCIIAALLAVPRPAAAARDDFTLVVLPDTQGYTVSSTLESTMGAQTQWVVDNRSRLNVAFVAQLGDLVESWPSVPMWERASKDMATLDKAGIPSSVLPGNHDMNVATGEATTYDQYFPPSRYANASWNSPSASYGGYLGQNLFGPDPVDRRNKDSFSLLTRSGLKLLILNLEYDPPQYALDWAHKVLSAYPDRRVILATHGFINTGGTRSSSTTRTDLPVNTAQQIWTKLVYDNCNIFMVVNGHWHDGERSEANRTDPNACGKPVHQLLTDYQDRANGGNGWLRYYTFKPDQNVIEAVTYSPTLGTYETDADSSFTLAYDMTQGPSTQRVLVKGGADWSWLYDNASWPAGWATKTYDDSTWRSGAAPLGFGSTGIVTNIDVPAPTTNRPRSALYRKTFSVASAAALSDVSVTTRADDGVVVYVNGTEIGRSGMPTGPLTNNSYALAAPRTSAATVSPATFAVPTSLLVDGVNVVAASTHLNYRGTADTSFDLTMAGTETTAPPPPPPPPATPQPRVLVATGADTRWRYEAGAWPSGWTSATYDDSAWRTGRAALGFGAPSVATNIDVSGPPANRPLSAQFRTTFEVTDPAAVSQVTLTTRADDGVVVYVNGTEVGRSGMPTGAVSASTYAASAPRTSAAVASPVTFAVPASLLRAGTNVIATSTHVNYHATPDLSYDVRLDAMVTP